MANLIPGYKYDIFISYRQKDNKGDRCVSKFGEILPLSNYNEKSDFIHIYLNSFFF